MSGSSENFCQHRRIKGRCDTCEVEQQRVQLAGCLTAADGRSEELASDAYGWSPAFAAVRKLRIHCDELASEAKDAQASADLRWKADMRGIKMWQEAHPGNDMVWPDHADLVVWLLDRLDSLQGAIREHHDQHADDLCWMDDNALYEAAGLPPRDATTGDEGAMLENCKRFIRQRCRGAGNWKSYADLEAENKNLQATVAELTERIAGMEHTALEKSE